VLPEASRRGCRSSPGWLTVIVGGSESGARPGKVTALPQRHDAWMAADEPVIVVGWYGARNYARSWPDGGRVIQREGRAPEVS
jgi:hypothetical protein